LRYQIHVDLKTQLNILLFFFNSEIHCTAYVVLLYLATTLFTKKLKLKCGLLLSVVIAAPVGVGPPTELHAFSGYMVQVDWEAPQSSSGLLTMTIITAYNLDHPEIPSLSEQVTDVNVQAREFAIMLLTYECLGNGTQIHEYTQL
jgi:hypothetical protein